jgi:hypothetical protein
MDATARAKFVRSYTKVLTGAWADEDFAARLHHDPRDVLEENGFAVPANASIEIRRTIDGEGDLDKQVELWENGASSGTYVLYVPDVPQIEMSELSDAQLDAVAGGDGEACCCCTSPCCSCT